MKIISEPLYKEIIKLVPILCIDLIIIYNNQYLLVKRKQNPLKNEWWVPGGRVHIGEKIQDAVGRKLYEELSISKSYNFKLCGFYEDFFDVSSFGSHLYHTLSIVYNVELLDLSDIITDQTSDQWLLKPDLPKRFSEKLERINV